MTALVLALAACPAVAEENHPAAMLTLSGQEAIDLAEHLYQQGKLDEAQAILVSLADADPENLDVVEVAFLAGLIAMEKQDYADAEEIFRTILDHDPSLVRVRLELARVLFLQKKDSGASYHFQLALANGLPDEVKNNIRRYLRQIEDRRVHSIRWASSVVPSSNINSGSDLETVRDLFGLPIEFRLSEDRQKKSGTGLSSSLTLAAFPKITDKWRLEMRGSVRVVDYSNDDFDDALFKLEIGPKYHAKKMTTSLLATLSKRQFAGEDYSKSIGTRLVLSTPLSQRTRVSANTSYAYTKYAYLADKDGPVYSAGATIQRAMSRKSLAALSLQATRQEARADSQKSTQYGVAASYRYELPHGITIQMSPQFLLRSYDGLDPLFPTRPEREDVVSEIALYLTKRDWRFMNFAPVFSYSYLKNDSNNDFYSYDRHSADVGLTREF